MVLGLVWVMMLVMSNIVDNHLLIEMVTYLLLLWEI